MQFMQTNEYILSQTKGKKYLLYSKEPKTTNSAQNDVSLRTFPIWSYQATAERAPTNNTINCFLLTSKEEAAANKWKNRYKEPSSFLTIQTGRPYFIPPPAIREYTCRPSKFGTKGKWTWGRSDEALHGIMPGKRFLHQYMPLKTGFVRHMLAPYSSYSAFVWQACALSRHCYSLQ